MDEKVLPDVQCSPDFRGIPLKQVGISDVHLPLKILEKGGGYQSTIASLDCYVDLPAHERGVHMSRIVTRLQGLANVAVDRKALFLTLEDIKQLCNSQGIFITARFPFFLSKETPKSALVGVQGYKCEFTAVNVNGGEEFTVKVTVPVITVCPCSREISDFGAHNQRAEITVEVYTRDGIIWLEDLIVLMEKCGSSQVYPILKRPDEKFVTEESFCNPKFVEDVLRDVVSSLKQLPQLDGFRAWVKSYESIHPHNALAYYSEGNCDSLCK